MLYNLPAGSVNLRQTKQELVQPSAIVENAPQFITAIRIGGTFAYYNPATVELSGYSQQELDSGGLHILLDKPTYKRLKEEIVPIIIKNGKHTYELPFVMKNGSERVMSISAFQLEADTDVIFSIASDITHLKNVQRKLEERTKELALQSTIRSAMFSSLPDIVFCKDADMRYIRCNKNFEKYLNCREADIIGKTQSEAFPIEKRMAERQRELEKKVIREERQIQTEEYIPCADGGRRLFEVTRTPLIYDDMPIGIMCIARDITERNAVEKTFKLALNNLDSCVFTSDINTGEILFANQKMLDEYGENNCIGKKCWDVLHRGQTQRCDFCPVPKLLESGEKEYVWENRNAVTGKYYRCADSIIDWHDGRRVHFQNAVDISDMKLMESNLISAKDIAEQGSTAKGHFLSHMSHEIRTPLNAIIGMIKIAMNSSNPERVYDCLGKADNASKHLLGVINNILDISKIEAGKFELDVHEFNFEKMLMTVTNITNFRAEEKKQTFIVDLSDNVPETIIADELRLAQIIANLLTNAVKFTPEHGTVTLAIDKIDDDGKEVELVISIEDNGIGISEEQQERLFSSFSQVGSDITRRFGGTGLGLAISKSIVELMGGNIWIESVLGKGSKFIFTIKAIKGKDRERLSLSEKIEKENMRILAVDDCPEICEYFKAVMHSLELPCDVALGSNEAIRMIENNTGKPYNIFFVDWKMPFMNGIELTKKIRELTNDNCYIFMVSSTNWSTIKKEATAAGVLSFISKPLYPSTLINAINECIEIKYRSTVNTGNEDVDFTGHTILIAEDVAINQEIMTALLEETGITIEYAINGIEAISMFKAAPLRYSLILMDIHMPKMDGYDATRTIRALNIGNSQTIPIIAMTANVFREDVERCLEIGMNDHIGKPVDMDDVIAKLARYLH